MDTLREILKDLRSGRMIVLTDSRYRENEGDLVAAAEKITPLKIAFMARYGRGLICVPLTGERARELDLPPMVMKNTSPLKCNFTVSVDAKKGVSTGISAGNRARTIQALLNHKTKPNDLTRPGHVFPLIGEMGGVLVRRGHTEGALDLMKLAGIAPMAVICEIMDDDGTMLRGKRLKKFADVHKLSICTIDFLVRYLRRTEKLVSRGAEAIIPTEYGTFLVVAYIGRSDGKEHVAFVKGEISKSKPTLVRVHSQCLPGDTFHSLRCDCGPQLDRALRRIAEEGNGVLLYLRQEGRGIGLDYTLKAYALQDQGYDTVSANEKLGLADDNRQYDTGAQILADLGISKIRLLTNNPRKISGLESYGLDIVEQIPLEVSPRSRQERRYLLAKKNKLGHLLRKV